MAGGFIIAAVALSVSSVLVKQINLNHAAMRFFRDVSRSKARRRLHGNKHALIPILLGVEEPYVPKSAEDLDAEESLTLTREELAEYDGFEEGTPLYLSISGRVYDVSKGEKFYGENGKYHGFVGTDATRAFATGCTREECISSSTEGLTESELREIDRWVELYETHDKYKFVGHLVDDPVNAILNGL